MTHRSYISKFVAVFLCIITLFSIIPINSYAATSGGSSSATITVNTKARYYYPGKSSITLRQNKQTLTYQQLFGVKTKTKTGYYGCYNITVYNQTKGTSKDLYWGGGQTKKIELDPNCTYKITVKYNANNTAIFTSQPWGYSWIRSSSPSWRVKSTWKVTSYS